MERYLYRGVNFDLYKQSEGKLIPKEMGKPFKDHAYYGNAYWGDGSVYGESETNVIIPHQRDSNKNPSSGVSTTPFYENAKIYATHNGKYETGFIYKIDTGKLAEFGVKYYEVSEYATQQAIPEDKEVILVAKDYSILPEEIIDEVIEV